MVTPTMLKSQIITRDEIMSMTRLSTHPGRILRNELKARKLSANKLALSLGVPSGRVTDILNGKRAVTADTAIRLGLFFGNSPQFWMNLQTKYDLAVTEYDKGSEIRAQVRDAAAV
jgi:addiction module HigA family antidote